MKKAIITFFIYALLLSFSCKEETIFNPDPPDELPPATMTGANTFGCLVNGKVWRPYTENIWESAINAKHDRGWVDCDQLLVSGQRRYSAENELNGILNQVIILNVWCPKLGENLLSPPDGAFLYFQDCGYSYRIDTLSSYFMNITFIDTTNNIASGTFEFTAIHDECQDTVRITEGRFDVDSSL